MLVIGGLFNCQFFDDKPGHSACLSSIWRLVPSLVCVQRSVSPRDYACCKRPGASGWSALTCYNLYTLTMCSMLSRAGIFSRFKSSNREIRDWPAIGLRLDDPLPSGRPLPIPVSLEQSYTYTINNTQFCCTCTSSCSAR